LFTAMAMPNGMEAQAVQKKTVAHQRYRVVDLGALGGPNSYFQSFAKVVNPGGEAIIAADTPNADASDPCLNPFGNTDCFIQHAGVWKRGKLFDLGTLPGGSYSNTLSITDNGLIAGGSDIGISDPLTGQVQQRAVLWQDNGKMIDLGTLGGNQSQAIEVNARGEVIGAALNAIPDDYAYSVAEITDAFAAATQTRAFLWQDGVMHDLGTLGGPDAFAQFINESGQVAGYSYTSSTPDPNTGLPPIHPFLWQHGQMFDLGTLGGAMGFVDDLNNAGQVVGPTDLAGDQTSHPYLWDRGYLVDLGTLGGDNGEAFAINDCGEIVGEADLPGSLNHHGFMWRNGSMTDLGTLGSSSRAQSINSKGQVVGRSRIGDVATTVQHGFLWENGGPLIDLNVLVPMGSNLTIEDAYFIDDLGEIAANGVFADGNQHAVLLVPDGDCDDLEARIAAFQNNAALAQNRPIIKQGESVSHAIQFRNRFVQRYRIPGPAVAPLN